MKLHVCNHGDMYRNAERYRVDLCCSCGQVVAAWLAPAWTIAGFAGRRGQPAYEVCDLDPRADVRVGRIGDNRFEMRCRGCGRSYRLHGAVVHELVVTAVDEVVSSLVLTEVIVAKAARRVKVRGDLGVLAETEGLDLDDVAATVHRLAGTLIAS
jgi:hypothetical protein